jgi:hypothetical protein
MRSQFLPLLGLISGVLLSQPVLAQQTPTGTIIQEVEGAATAATGATDAEPAPETTMEVTFVNDGESAIDLYVRGAEPDAELISTGFSLPPFYEVALNLKTGDRVFAYESDAAADDARDNTHFFEFTIGADAADLPLHVPDARYFRPVELQITNTYTTDVVVFLPDPQEQTDQTEIGRIPSGETAPFDLLPGTEVFLQTDDKSLFTVYTVGLDKTQTFSLDKILRPAEGLAPVEVFNFFDLPITIDEVTDTSLMRLANLDPEKKIEIKARAGAELRILSGAEFDQEIGTYRVLDSNDQTVAIFGPEDDTVVSLPRGIDLSVLDEPDRTRAAKFLEASKQLAEDKTAGVLPYIGYNRSDETLWFSGLKGTELVGPKQVKPHSTVNVLARLGTKSIVWPGDIDPEDVTVGDIFTSIDVSRKMNRVVDLSRPRDVTFQLANSACKPLDVYAVTPLGNEELLTRLEPLEQLDKNFSRPENTALIARAGSESVFAGQRIWSTALGGKDGQVLNINLKMTAFDDPLLVSTPDENDKKAKNVRLYNSSSRALELYYVDTEGREVAIPEGAIETGSNIPFKLYKGDLIVLRRPNVPHSISEYARFRVTENVNQEIDTKDLAKSVAITGTWIDEKNSAIPDPNMIGTRYVTFVEQGDGKIAGSMNIGDGAFNDASAFKGCADQREAFGRWIPVGDGGYECKDGFSPEPGKKFAGGLFSARRVGENGLVLKRGICSAAPRYESEWYNLPLHFDDMDPSKAAFERGMFNLTWAPPSFDWLGRGYNLLKTDPLNFGSGEAGINSDAPLFSFVYQDAAGQAVELNSKKIFGVNNQNEGGSSGECTVESKMVKTMDDLRDFSSTSYSGSVGVPSVGSFSLSKSHKEVNTAATGSEKLYILDRCDVRLHVLKMQMRWLQFGNDLLRQRLSPDFRKAVEQLPVNWQPDDLLAFLERFGTHFSERIEYGGTFFAKTEVTKDIYQRGTQVGDTLAVEASGTLKKVQLGGGLKKEDESAAENKDINEVANYEKWTVGGDLSEVYSSWIKTVPERPAPVNISFRPIYDILTPVFFPDDPEIGLKNAILRKAVSAYFKRFGVEEVTSDPRQLDVLDPSKERKICFQMDLLEVNLGPVGDITRADGELFLSVAGTNGKPLNSEAYSVVDLNNSQFSKNLKYIFLDQNPYHCLPKTSADYIRNGSLYLHGQVSLNRGNAGRKRFSKNIPEKTFPLSEVVPGEVTFFEGKIPLEGSQAHYELSIWEE